MGDVVNAPLALRWVDEALPCGKCALPTHWRNQFRGRVHPNCEPMVDLTPEAEVEQLFMFARILGAVMLPEDYEPLGPRQTIALKGGGCGWCDRQGIAITDDDYFHCYVHMWPPYRWPPPAQEVPA